MKRILIIMLRSVSMDEISDGKLYCLQHATHRKGKKAANAAHQHNCQILRSHRTELRIVAEHTDERTREEQPQYQKHQIAEQRQHESMSCCRVGFLMPTSP